MTRSLDHGVYRCPWPSSDASRSVTLHLRPGHRREDVQFHLEIWNEGLESATLEARSPPFELGLDPKLSTPPVTYAVFQIALALAQNHVFAESVSALLYTFWWRQLVDHKPFQAWVFERFPVYKDTVLRIFHDEFHQETP